MRDLGWTDAFRAINGYGTRDASWTFAGDRGGWRLDHVLVDGCECVAASYEHEWRRAGLSDHSALIVDVAPANGGIKGVRARLRGWCTVVHPLSTDFVAPIRRRDTIDPTPSMLPFAGPG